MVPSGIFTAKFSAMVAPITANVSSSGRLPVSAIEGEYARNGDFVLSRGGVTVVKNDVVLYVFGF